MLSSFFVARGIVVAALPAMKWRSKTNPRIARPLCNRGLAIIDFLISCRL
ncbi:MAG TPA: hypothetical protein PK006_05180 [Saprospiraceae bacterium]|nr:hypothetical protein [Saprospiraceae bacterium]